MKNIPQAYRPSYLWFWPPLILGGFSNFCRYYTRSQAGKSIGYPPTLKPLRVTDEKLRDTKKCTYHWRLHDRMIRRFLVCTLKDNNSLFLNFCFFTWVFRVFSFMFRYIHIMSFSLQCYQFLKTSISTIIINSQCY